MSAYTLHHDDALAVLLDLPDASEQTQKPCCVKCSHGPAGGAS